MPLDKANTYDFWVKLFFGQFAIKESESLSYFFNLMVTILKYLIN